MNLGYIGFEILEKQDWIDCEGIQAMLFFQNHSKIVAAYSGDGVLGCDSDEYYIHIINYETKRVVWNYSLRIEEEDYWTRYLMKWDEDTFLFADNFKISFYSIIHPFNLKKSFVGSEIPSLRARHNEVMIPPMIKFDRDIFMAMNRHKTIFILSFSKCTCLCERDVFNGKLNTIKGLGNVSTTLVRMYDYNGRACFGCAKSRVYQNSVYFIVSVDYPSSSSTNSSSTEILSKRRSSDDSCFESCNSSDETETETDTDSEEDDSDGLYGINTYILLYNIVRNEIIKCFGGEEGETEKITNILGTINLSLTRREELLVVLVRTKGGNRKISIYKDNNFSSSDKIIIPVKSFEIPGETLLSSLLFSKCFNERFIIFQTNKTSRMYMLDIQEKESLELTWLVHTDLKKDLTFPFLELISSQSVDSALFFGLTFQEFDDEDDGSFYLLEMKGLEESLIDSVDFISNVDYIAKSDERERISFFSTFERGVIHIKDSLQRDTDGKSIKICKIFLVC